MCVYPNPASCLDMDLILATMEWMVFRQGRVGEKRFESSMLQRFVDRNMPHVAISDDYLEH